MLVGIVVKLDTSLGNAGIHQVEKPANPDSREYHKKTHGRPMGHKPGGVGEQGTRTNDVFLYVLLRRFDILSCTE